MHEDYIVGHPSGEVLDIKPSMINFLTQEGLITFSPKLQSFIFIDEEYNEIRRAINKLNNNHPNPVSYSKQVLDFLKQQKGCRFYTIHKDSSVSVDGGIKIVNEKMKLLPFKFSEVTGNFIVENCELEQLMGCPKKVGGNFIVRGNNLTDLLDGPVLVGRNYDCSDNLLSDLVGSPEHINGDFDCSSNLLLTLHDAPRTVRGVFNCRGNKHLTSLIGAPKTDIIISDIKKLRKLRDYDN